jgi:hypothetical protein
MRRALYIPRVRAIVFAAEVFPANTNPFESVKSMQCIISRARSAERITRVFETLYDRRQAGFLRATPPTSAFDGTATGAGGKGIVEVMLMQWDIAQYMVICVLI